MKRLVTTAIFAFAAALPAQEPGAPSARGSDELLLLWARFDPLAGEPAIPAALRSDARSRLRIVQYSAPASAARNEALRAAGGEPLFYLPHRAEIVSVHPDAAAAVAALPFVRWAGPYHPAYRIAAADQAFLAPSAPAEVWSIVAARKHDLATKRRIADALEAAGGALHFPLARESWLLTMRLPPAALRAAIAHDEVLWVDRWAPPTADMDLTRAATGANYVATVVPSGFQGQGVRGEVPDLGCLATHVDLTGLLWHGTSAVNSHGTSTYGIAFGKGVANPMGLGLLPQGQGVAAYIFDPTFVSNRYGHTAELLTPAWECVFQSNSSGGNQTTIYTALSLEMDDIIFDLDLPITQSQSNQGSQLSRPQAWAKNVIAVGGVFHQNTLTTADDSWSGGASIGPAQDGRIKPDVCSFYDQIFTTTSSSTTAYDSNFNGTSAATPIVAGCLGLTIEMWAAGLFGPTNPGATVFAKRPHAATSKALLINNAASYAFSGLSHDLTRTHQGWGAPDLVRTHDRAAAGKALVIDETVVLPALQSASFTVNVAAGEPDLRATLTWSDPPGAPSALQHRINDLDLEVTSPSGTLYRGNNGLLTGNWSVAGGTANGIDTVENVFVQNPAAGAWTVRVRVIEVNQDGHVETPALDTDFALVVTGGSPQAPGAADTGQANSAQAAMLVNGGTNVHGQNALLGIHGPFFATAAVGGTLAFSWSGAPNTPVILAASALRRNNVVFPVVGSLDVGLLGPASIADVAILLDGLSGTSVLDQLADTGPFGGSTLAFTVPALPPGVLGAFQAALVPAGSLPILTGAFEVTIQ